jgi:hypothetical protein
MQDISLAGTDAFNSAVVDVKIVEVSARAPQSIGKHIWAPEMETKILVVLNWARLGFGVAILTHIVARVVLGIWHFAHDASAVETIPLFWQIGK